MKIQNSQVNLYGNSYDHERTQVKRKLTQTKLVPTMREQLRQLQREATQQKRVETEPGVEFHMSEKDYQMATLLEKLLSRLLGREVKFTFLGKGSFESDNYDGKTHQIMNNNMPQMTYEEEIKFQKTSHISLKSSGTVTTEDGREIKFDFDLSHTRNIEFNSYRRETIGQAVDPLVLSFDGTLPALSNQSFSFDLDHDGTSDQVSYLTGNSGFLALDKNEDGVINDGRELFGPNSGSGFQDLRAYDGDGNGWIDENDEVFDKLRIWMKNDNGEDRLLALGQKGVGAIFLGAVSTQYELMTDDLVSKGIISESGIYLREDGGVNNMHHLDIII